MKRFSRIAYAATLILTFLATMIAPAMALDRVTWYYSINPPSSWWNQWERNTRIGFGQNVFDDFGSTASFFTNTCVVPGSGLYVTVQPCNANSLASLYMYQAEEATSWGGGTYGPSTALAADNTQVHLQGLLTNAAAPSIGPLNPPGTSGYSIIYAIECKVNTVDTTSQTEQFVSATDATTSLAVNRDRADQWFCQSKAGTAAASPSPPTIDTGYLGVALVTVAYGAASITSGNIAMTTANGFYGFLRLASTGVSANQFVCTNANSQATTSGCGSSTLSLSASTPLAFTNTGTATVTSAASGSVAALIFNVTGGTTGDLLDIQQGGSNECQFLNGGALTCQGYGTFAGISAGTGTIKGSSNGVTATYLPPVYTVSGGAEASGIHAVFGTVTYSISGTCTTLTICSASSSSNEVTLSGAAQFSAYNTYSCNVMDYANGGGTIVTNNGVATAAGSSGSIFWITLFNQSNASISGNVTMNYYCVGT